ncbi:MAG: prolipoprotein diacylglyceryl transferase [Xanthomonadales bacterium]|nr:prolipoprotein diacylglyceryl transferase [Xanthomonadales bacterium]
MPYYVNFDPVAFSLGPLKIHWYGIMYLVGFICFWLLGSYRAGRPNSGWKKEEVSDFLFYGALGVILGGRLGYILFYDFANVIDDPLRILQIWKGGMSFHGGFLGVLVAMLWFARKTGRRFFQVSDFFIPMIAPGLFFGRVGNFIGGELWGRVSDAPWAMIFPRSIDVRPWNPEVIYQQYLAGQLNDQARHPSQLYEALLEGLLLFVIVWVYSSKPRPAMAVTGFFMIGYGAFRSLVEHYREPDADKGFLLGDWLTMGQLLSFPLIAAGLVMMILASRKRVAVD